MFTRTLLNGVALLVTGICAIGFLISVFGFAISFDFRGRLFSVLWMLGFAGAVFVLWKINTRWLSRKGSPPAAAPVRNPIIIAATLVGLLAIIVLPLTYWKLTARYKPGDYKLDYKLDLPGFGVATYQRILADAQAGTAVAEYSLGRAYVHDDFSWGVNQDYTQAAAWFRKSADQGYVLAQLSLANLYLQGFGVPQSNVEAYFWYGLAFRDPLLVQTNISKEHFTAVASQLTSEERASNDKLIASWKPIENPFPPALEGIRMAAEKGDTKAQEQLANDYRIGSEGVTRDAMEAVKWFRMAAKAGDVAAEIALGRTYQYGQDGISPDYDESLKWWRMAARKGNQTAEYSVALFYREGLGVPKDDRKALAMWHVLANQGERGSQIGLMTYYFSLDSPDYEDAYYWGLVVKRRECSGDLCHVIVPVDRFLQVKSHLTAEQRNVIEKRVAAWKDVGAPCPYRCQTH